PRACRHLVEDERNARGDTDADAEQSILEGSDVGREEPHCGTSYSAHHAPFTDIIIHHPENHHRRISPRDDH
ncbi:MAG: hypothetical protein WCS62_05100, partial [Bacilli bacterium]